MGEIGSIDHCEAEFTFVGTKLDSSVTRQINNFVDLEKMEVLNYSIVINTIKRIFKIGKNENKQINHLLMSLPDTSDKLLNDLEKMFYKFLWDNKPDKFKRQTVGGLKMINIVNFTKALKGSWIRRLIRDETSPGLNYILTISDKPQIF